MIKKVDFHLKELESMKSYPCDLFYIGDITLLRGKKIAVVGSRKPNSYARGYTAELTSKLARNGAIVVSGGAIGIDAIAHKNAGAKNTIMVAATGLERRYPAINKNLIAEIEGQGLVLSQFRENTPSHKYNFVLRNELTVALGDVLVVTYADEGSGTMRSVEYALAMGKKIYVLPHRIGESEATNRLLKEKKAEAIYDIDSFVEAFCGVNIEGRDGDDFLSFCRTNPTYEEALKAFPKRVFESELLGEIEVVNGRIRVLT